MWCCEKGSGQPLSLLDLRLHHLLKAQKVATDFRGHVTDFVRPLWVFVVSVIELHNLKAKFVNVKMDVSLLKIRRKSLPHACCRKLRLKRMPKCCAHAPALEADSDVHQIQMIVLRGFIDHHQRTADDFVVHDCKEGLSTFGSKRLFDVFNGQDEFVVRAENVFITFLKSGLNICIDILPCLKAEDPSVR